MMRTQTITLMTYVTFAFAVACNPASQAVTTDSAKAPNTNLTLTLDWPSTPAKVDFPSKPDAEALALQPQAGVNYMWMAMPAAEGQTLEANCKAFANSFAVPLKANATTSLLDAHGIAQCHFEVSNPVFGLYGSMAKRGDVFHLAYATLEGTGSDPAVVSKAKAFTASLRFE